MDEESLDRRLTSIQTAVLQVGETSSRACQIAAETKAELAGAILESRAETSTKIDAVHRRMDRSFGDTTTRIGGLEGRIDGHEVRISHLERSREANLPDHAFVKRLRAVDRDEAAETRVVSRWKTYTVRAIVITASVLAWPAWSKLKAAAVAAWPWLHRP